MSAPYVVATPIHRRIELAADGTRRERIFVRCPRGADWEPIERCRQCDSCAHLSTPDRVDDWLLFCEVRRSTTARAHDDAAERTPVTLAMDASVLCVGPDVPTATVATSMRDGDFEIAVVTDPDGRPIGIIAPVDLAPPRGSTAGSTMTPFATSLLEDAPIARALAFATEGELQHIPILSSGRVMGLVSPRSLLGPALAFGDRMTLSRHPIADFMTRSPHSIGLEQPLDVAHRMMKEHAIRHLPVLEGGTLVGLLSQRDLYLTEALEPLDTHAVRVEEAMTQGAYVVGPDEPLESVATTMAERKLGCAVVMIGPKVVGLFTTVDALRAIVHLIQASRP